MLLSLSSRGDYGFLIMSSLAEAPNGAFVSVSEIARQKNVPSAYAGQLIAQLKKARLVESKEGVSGGYRLAKPATEITLKEIVEALEGPIAPVKCLQKNHEACPCEPVCGMKPIWQETVGILEQQLSNRKLSDIIKR